MKKIITNYIYNSIYQILTIVVPLITTPYLARIIGADGLGKYAYSYSVAYMFFIFIKLGLNNYGNRTIALCRDNKQERDKQFSSIYSLQVIIAIIVAIIYIIYCLFSEERTYAYIMLFYVVSAGFDISWFYFGIEDFKKTAVRDTIVKAITLLLVFVVVKRAEDAWKYSLIRSLGFLISQISLWINLRRYVKYIKPSIGEIKNHLYPNLFLFIPTVAVSIYKYMDKIMLGAMVGSNEVGIYHGCENIIAVPLALVVSLGNVMMPKMAKLYNGPEERNANDVISKSICFAIFVTSFVGFGIMSVAREFVPVFYGDGFGECVALYYIIIPSCIFVAFANVIKTQFLIPNSWDRAFIISVVIGAIFNVITNYMLIPGFGARGAAIGTFIAEVTVCVMQAVFVKNILPINRYMKLSLKYVIVGVILFILLRKQNIFLLNNSIISIFAKLILYSTLYLGSISIVILLEKIIRKNLKYHLLS